MYACWMMTGASTIYLDADACPVKDQVYNFAARYGIPLKVVANSWPRVL